MMDFINMEDKFKHCVKCGNRMNVIDSHDEYYRHQVNNVLFPCDVCKNWVDEKCVIDDHLLYKVRQKAIKLSVKGVGHKTLKSLSASATISCLTDDQVSVTSQDDFCAGELHSLSS